jgi:ankyrin repeat protein
MVATALAALLVVGVLALPAVCHRAGSGLVYTSAAALCLVHLCGQPALGAPVHAYGPHVASPQAAARAGDLPALRLALRGADADVNARDSSGRAALHWAAGDGHSDAVELLLTAPGIDINALSADGWSALFVAAEQGHTAVVRLLAVAPGVDLNVRTADGRSALHGAAWKGRTGAVRALLAASERVQQDCAKDGRLSAHSHIYSSHVIAYTSHHAWCQQAGTDLDVNAQAGPGPGSYSGTALQWAAQQGYAEVVAALLAAPGVDAEAADDFGQTPLAVAVAEAAPLLRAYVAHQRGPSPAAASGQAPPHELRRRLQHSDGAGGGL